MDGCCCCDRVRAAWRLFFYAQARHVDGDMALYVRLALTGDMERNCELAVEPEKTAPLYR